MTAACPVFHMDYSGANAYEVVLFIFFLRGEEDSGSALVVCVS